MSASLVKSLAALGMIRFPKPQGRKRPGFPARKPKRNQPTCAGIREAQRLPSLPIVTVRRLDWVF